MASCNGTQCSFNCVGGFGDCNKVGANQDGCETNLGTSTANCGLCGRPCSAAGTTALMCTGGVCTSSCAAGFANCTHPMQPAADDGCETDVTSDPANCGGCARACSNANASSSICVSGLCNATCVSGFSDCTHPAAPGADNGCELPTSGDVNHCGGCTTVCPAGNGCQNAVCSSSSCGFVSKGGSGCCTAIDVSGCSPNTCQTANCTNNQCTYSGKTGVSGCCSTPANCPKPSGCDVATCTNNFCGVMAMACPDGGVDFSQPPDLLVTLDLSTPPAPDLSVPDLSMPATPDLAVPDLSSADQSQQLTLTGAGGCNFGSESGVGGLWWALGLLLARRRRAQR
jgi:hypothetical protein